MLHHRVIPVILLQDKGCVKTVKFKNPTYLGDPKNIIKIFNDKEVDEIVILDINASIKRNKPNINFLKELTVECFMPVSYGGGISSFEEAKKLFSIGIEKIIINSFAFNNMEFIRKLTDYFGNQSIVISMDVKKNIFGHYKCYSMSGSKNTGIEPVEFAKIVEKNGAGEILLNSIDNDGMMQGYDIELIKKVSDSVDIPVIACGGAGKLKDFGDAVSRGNASAVAAGSFFVFQGIHRAVLISYPHYDELEQLFIK